MKLIIHKEASFTSKMVLLFALVLLAVPERRKSIEMFVKNLSGSDTTSMGQAPVTRIAGQAHFQSSFNR
jgi:hypothetical protein